MSISEQDLRSHVVTVLKQLGYQSLSASTLLESRGATTKNPLLENVLRQQLVKLNEFQFEGVKYKFSAHNIEDALFSLKYAAPNNYSRMFHLLRYGKSYLETIKSASRSFNIKYIDWDNIENNIFHIVREFRTAFESKERIVDIVLFINGIPIVLMELKSEGVAEEPLKELELLTNKQTENTPVSFAQLLLAISAQQVKYNTTYAENNPWPIWPVVNSRTGAVPESRLDALTWILHDICEPTRLLHYIKYFILISDKHKMLGRNYHVNAIQHAIKRISLYKPDGSRRGGIISQPTGTGVLYTMMFLAHQLMMRKDIYKVKILIVSDRISSDMEIADIFSQYGFYAKSATSVKHLFDLLSGDDMLVTTVMNKFYNVPLHNIYNNEHDLFIFIDEVQRGHSGAFHWKMRTIFPSACYIGFTRTPFVNGEHSHYEFDDLIYLYSLKEAIEDNISLPIMYEHRCVFNSKEDTLIELPEGNKTWKKNFQSNKVFSSEKGINIIAEDIIKHFHTNNKGTPFKAMLATSSREAAIRYKYYFDSKKGSSSQVNTAVIISDTRSNGNINLDNYYQDILIEKGGHTAYESDVIRKLHLPSNDVEIVIVCDRLLTGLDAPYIKTLYLTKYLQKHYLLQAIARVSRPEKDKYYGQVVDYLGLMDNLKEALGQYGQLEVDERNEEGIISLTEAVEYLKLYFEKLDDYQKYFLKSKKRKTENQELADKESINLYWNEVLKLESVLKFVSFNTDAFSVLKQDEINTYRERLWQHKQFLEKNQFIQTLHHTSSTNIQTKEKSGIPDILSDDQLALSFFALLKGFLNNKKIQLPDEQIAIFSLSTAKKVKTLTIRDWQTSSKVRREINNYIEDQLLSFSERFNLALNFIEIDNILIGYMNAASVIVINNKK
jgi:type I restriction enzyme R subunit